MRLGLGSMKCGSWYPLPSDSTLTRFWPTSFASDPSVGMEETTCRTASSASMRIRPPPGERNSVRMGAVGADGVFELEESGGRPLRIDHGQERGAVVRMLRLDVQAHAGELAALKGEAPADALGPRQHAAGRNADHVAADAQEPAPRELGDDLRIGAAVPLVLDPVAAAHVAEDRLGLERQRLVALRHV